MHFRDYLIIFFETKSLYKEICFFKFLDLKKLCLYYIYILIVLRFSTFSLYVQNIITILKHYLSHNTLKLI